MEEGLSIALTPPQLAAVLSGGSLAQPSAENRGWGFAKAIFGGLEILGGSALLLLPEPTTLSKISGGILGAHGVDSFQAGARQAWTGVNTDTLTSDGTTALAQLLGVDAETAESIGDGVDLFVPLAVAGALAAVRVVAVRSGRLSLAAHEAQGGHTIARHVGRTEAELRARLASQKTIPVASTFRTLEQAEHAVASGLRANRNAIVHWARSAAPGAKQSFEWASGSPIGQGVIRASGRLVQMSRVRIVLKKQAIQGKLYYVLTAFPIP